MLVYRRPWTRQPPIAVALDRTNPLAQSFQAAWLPAVSPHNLAGTGGTLPVRGDGIVVIPQAGLGIAMLTDNQAIVSEQAMPAAAGYPATMVWVGRSLSVLNPSFFGVTSASPPGGSYFYVYSQSGTSVNFSARNNFGTAMDVGQNVPGGTSFTDYLVIVAQSVSQTDHRLCVNGSDVATSATDIGALVAWDRAVFGVGNSTNDHQTAAALLGFGGRAMSDVEMRWLSRRPENVYSLFTPLPARRWAPSGGSAIPVLSAATVAAITQTTATPRVTVTF